MVRMGRPPPTMPIKSTVLKLGTSAPQAFKGTPTPRPQDLFAERLGSSGEHLRHAERFGQVTSDAEVHGFDRARFGREAGDDDDRKVAPEAFGFANQRKAVH